MTSFASHKILFKQLFPFTFIVLIWLIHLTQAFLGQDWSNYALTPRTAHGLIGIITCPLLHGSWEHLLGNTVPLLILGLILFNSYREIAGKVFWLVYLLNGVLLWLFARGGIHLGASGVIYGLAFFLVVSGFIRRDPRLGMISLLIIFIYGSMVWGIFPFDTHVSWEGHLYGALTGIILAVMLRKQGPQARVYWTEEENEPAAVEPENAIEPAEPTQPEENREPRIRYLYKDKNGTHPE